MFTKDYIMRMIEQLVMGIALIAGLKQENKIEESEAALTDTLRKFFGLNDSSLETLPWRQLMAVVGLGGIPDAEKCALLAQLIKEKADIEALQGNKELSHALYIKALNLYLSALLADEYLRTAEHTGNIEALQGVVKDDAHTADTLHLLFRYEDASGRYAKAEDRLYALFDTDADKEQLKEQGRAFYFRLMEKSDDELVRGNLPRNEILDGLNGLNSH